MDYLDPKKQKQHLVRLIIGYILVTIALGLMTTILVYRSYGFGIGKNGEVTQSGLVFISSRPDAAEIYINGRQQAEATNARLLVPSGQYTFELRRTGYQPWKRAISVEGSSVMRFDYPVLFPTKLTTTTVKRYDVQPPLSTQSPDRRWYLIQSPAALLGFDVYDLKNPEETPVSIAVPEATVGLQGGLHRWAVVEWARDNHRMLLLHTMDKDGVTNAEYILVDRADPDQSVNLTRSLNSGTSAISLRDKKFDQYYIYTSATASLQVASLDQPTAKAFLDHVLAFKAYGSDTVLYVTNQGAAEGMSVVRLREGDTTRTIRQVTTNSQYMLGIARYSHHWYVAVGSPAEGKTYIYKDPMAALQDKPRAPLVPVQILKTPMPSTVAFSDNSRFVMTQGGQHVAVYDAETDRGYGYQLDTAPDAAQPVQWMDGHRLTAIMAGKLQVFDFDRANKRDLVAAGTSLAPVFDPNFKVLYALVSQVDKAADGGERTQYILTATSLLTPQDQ